MDRLRVATEPEIEQIRSRADLDPTCVVLALNTQAGVPLAVVRLAVEVDPVVFPEGFPDRLKAVFQRDIETYLAAKGVAHYYFNIDAVDETWQTVAKTWGAEQVSVVPEIRFKKAL
jgi:hypothetical protein